MAGQRPTPSPPGTSSSFQAEAARLGLKLRVLQVLHGFNYSRGRDTVLPLYGPAAPEP